METDTRGKIAAIDAAIHRVNGLCARWAQKHESSTFCTHEGSGLGSTPRSIAYACPDATVLDGIAASSASVNNSRGKIERWINSLKY